MCAVAFQSGEARLRGGGAGAERCFASVVGPHPHRVGPRDLCFKEVWLCLSDFLSSGGRKAAVLSASGWWEAGLPAGTAGAPSFPLLASLRHWGASPEPQPECGWWSCVVWGGGKLCARVALPADPPLWGPASSFSPCLGHVCLRRVNFLVWWQASSGHLCFLCRSSGCVSISDPRLRESSWGSEPAHLTSVEPEARSSRPQLLHVWCHARRSVPAVPQPWLGPVQLSFS